DVRAAMLSDPRAWLANIAATAGEDGDRLLVDVGLQVAGREVSRRAGLDVGEPMTADRVVLLPLRLRIEEHERLFPSLDGSLDAACLGPGPTHPPPPPAHHPPSRLLR